MYISDNVRGIFRLKQVYEEQLSGNWPTDTSGSLPANNPLQIRPYGYFGGGFSLLSTVDRIDYSNDTATASPKGPLSAGRYGLAATGNASFGYFGGGSGPATATSIVDRIDYSNDTATSTKGPLSAARRYLTATGNSSFGYFGGGGPFSIVDRIDYSNDTATASPKGPLSDRKSNLAATGNSSFGYFGGGYIFNFTSIVDRIDYSNDTATASPKGPLSSARRRLAATGNSSFGYFGGGNGVSTVDRIDYSNDTATVSVRGPLSVGKESLEATGNSSFGYFGGGSPGPFSTVDRIDYSNDTATASVKGPLSLARFGLAAASPTANGLSSQPATPAPSTSSIVTSGLVLNLDAGDSSSYPGSGTTWTDLSGNGNNATLINGPTYSSANGGSIVFDGTNDYAALGSGSLINGLTDITLEVWFKADSTGTNRGLIYGDTNDSLTYDNGCSLRYDSAGAWGGGTNLIKTGFGQNAASNTSLSANAIESSSNIQTTGWTCITVTADVGSSISLYKNGQLDTPTYSISNKETSISNCTNFVIGKDGGGSSGGNYWDGSISIVRVYNRALSASEVQQNYDALKDRFTETVVTSGLQLYLDAGDSSSYPGSGTTWYDLSGNGRNFTWNSVSFTSGSIPYFSTLGKKATGPASNSFGINNTSGYTIFLISMQNTLSNSGAFEFHSSTAIYNRGIFSHCTWGDNVVYFDQGGCCGSDTRVQVSSGGSQTWNIWTFRRFTNSSTRTISKNGSTLVTNTASAANINLSTTGASVGGTASYTNWNARLGGFIVYNRGLSDAEVTQTFNALKGRYGL